MRSHPHHQTLDFLVVPRRRLDLDFLLAHRACAHRLDLQVVLRVEKHERLVAVLVRDLDLVSLGALDLLFTLIFWRKPKQSLLSERLEEYVNLTGIFLLIGLLIVVTVKDIRDAIKPDPKPPTFKTSPSAGPPSSPSPAPVSAKP